MNVIIPMAGKGQRFKDAGYKEDKPFINVNGRPMVEVALQNLGILDAHYHFLVCPGHETRVREIAARNLRSWEVYTMHRRLPGAVPACLTLEAELSPHEPLIIANCDQIIRWNPVDFISFCHNNSGLVGIIPTFESSSHQHSYALCDTLFHERVCRIAEKQVISQHALCGVHYWNEACCAFWSFRQALYDNPHFNNDYYIAPTYNHLIDNGIEVLRYKTDGMVVLGTPEKLEKYLEDSNSNIGDFT